MPDRRPELEAFADELVRLMRAANVTQISLGQQLGTSRQAVGEWARAQTEPSRHHLQALERALGVDPGHLAARLLPEAAAERASGYDGVEHRSGDTPTRETVATFQRRAGAIIGAATHATGTTFEEDDRQLRCDMTVQHHGHLVAAIEIAIPSRGDIRRLVDRLQALRLRVSVGHGDHVAVIGVIPAPGDFAAVVDGMSGALEELVQYGIDTVTGPDELAAVLDAAISARPPEATDE